MTEPDVALTDYAVTLECLLLAGLLFRGIPARRGLRRLFAIFFVSAAIGAVAGGTVHGFLLHQSSPAREALWRSALLALGVTTFAGWSIGGRLIFVERWSRWIEGIAAAQLVVYGLIVLAWDSSFRTAVLNYAPSAVFLGASFFIAFWRKPDRAALAGLAGVILTILAAVVQRWQIAFQAVPIGHNALYHVIQIVAFASIFLAGRHFIAVPAVR